ncbi:MAG: tail fiber protein [Gallionella sp.]|nr:tail fiber protein [Gallionella sp.]
MDPFLGEIRMMGFNNIPQGWVPCAGQILPVSQNQALFSLLGGQYGGDGRTTFALPDLRGRVPVCMGSADGSINYAVGNKAGVEAVALTLAQMPAHNHNMGVNTAPGTFPGIPGHVLAAAPNNIYATPDSAMIPINPASVVSTGDGQGHSNMQPFAVTNFYIATEGLYPPRA